MRPEDQFQEKSHVSRETLALYQAWHSLLLKWNRRINLVAKSTLPDFWMRHALDSWQITPYLKETDRQILDFGSGAGFPGISAAIAMREIKGANVTMAESAGKKASFLRTVIRELDLPANVYGGRIEEMSPIKANVITARAFAPLGRLLDYADPFIMDETRLILLKGEAVDEEITAAQSRWTFNAETIQSLSDEAGCILLIKDIKRLNPE